MSSSSTQQAQTTQPDDLEEDVSGLPASPLHVRSFAIGLMRGQPGLIVTLGYLLLTAVGITYEYLFYNLFYIPILNLSEPGDFLLAGFQEPVLLLFVILSVLMLRRLIDKDRKWRQRSVSYRSVAEKMESRWFLSIWVLYPLFIFIYFLSITMFYARFTAKRIIAGVGRNVAVELNVSSAHVKQDNHSHTELLLGTNSKFVFLYSPGENRVQIVPIASVSTMTMGSAARGVAVPDLSTGKAQAPTDTVRPQSGRKTDNE